MTSPILTPGTPEYEKWYKEYRERKIKERLETLAILAVVILLGVLVSNYAKDNLGFPYWYSSGTGYIVVGLIFYVFAMMRDYGVLRQTFRYRQWGRVAAHLLLTIVFWPLIIIFALVFN